MNGTNSEGSVVFPKSYMIHGELGHLQKVGSKDQHARKSDRDGD